MSPLANHHDIKAKIMKCSLRGAWTGGNAHKMRNDRFNRVQFLRTFYGCHIYGSKYEYRFLPVAHKRRRTENCAIARCDKRATIDGRALGSFGIFTCTAEAYQGFMGIAYVRVYSLADKEMPWWMEEKSSFANFV